MHYYFGLFSLCVVTLNNITEIKNHPDDETYEVSENCDAVDQRERNTK